MKEFVLTLAMALTMAMNLGLYFEVRNLESRLAGAESESDTMYWEWIRPMGACMKKTGNNTFCPLDKR
jgi:hypothetical protein